MSSKVHFALQPNQNGCGNNLMETSVPFSHLDIEEKLRIEVSKKQIRPKEFFTDFDPLRKGHVNEDKFRTGLSLLSKYLVLKEDDIQTLLSSLINYIEFCNNIDKEDNNNFTSENSQTKIGYINPEIQKIINAFRGAIERRRLLIKQPFQDFDKTRSSHITVDQFSRVLNLLGILPPKPIFNIISQFYIDNEKDVNYNKFCQDVENYKSNISKDEISNENVQLKEKKTLKENSDNFDLSQNLFASNQFNKSLELEAIIKRVQGEVIMKNIRINQFFNDFDKLKKGVVTETQFRRILDISKICFSEDEMEVLKSSFMDSNGMFMYFEFCEAIDKILTTKGIEKDPLYCVPPLPKNVMGVSKFCLPMNASEEDQLKYVIDCYASAIAVNRILLKPHFQDFDKTKIGYVSRSQFLRILNQFKLFAEPEVLNLILKKYMDKGNLDEVNYYDFCRDIDMNDHGYKQAIAHTQKFRDTQFIATMKENQNSHPINLVENLTLEDILANLRRKVKETRVRLGEFLRDFDKLRSGLITNNQFRLGLSVAKVYLTDQEFNIICESFQNPEFPNMMLWRDFCNSIDQVFTTKGLEKANPLAEIPIVKVAGDLAPLELNPEEKRQAENAKSRFRAFCIATRLDIKQFFKDWDKLNRNKVSPKQFRQVLSTVNFIISDKEYEALVKMYQSVEDKEVKYVEFIKETSPEQENSNSKGLMLIQSQLNKYSTDYQNLSIVIMNKIKKTVKTNRLRIGEYFIDFDPLRKGTIPANKFKGIISLMKIDLSEEEINTLESMYLSEDDCTKVDYNKFISDVNIVFTKTGLEKDPLTKPEEFKPPIFLDPRGELTSEEEEDLHNFLIRLGEVVYKHRILLKPSFQDKDKAKSGKVAFTRFRSILDVHKIPLQEEEFRLMCKRFGKGTEEFNYIEFVEILKKYESGWNNIK